MSWSQVEHMVTFVASSVMLHSRGSRIVLLTTDSKIIGVGEGGEMRIVHNLGLETEDSFASSHVITSILTQPLVWL